MFQLEQENFCLSVALFTFLWRMREMRGFTSFSNFRGGSRGRGQGVRTLPEMTCGFLIQLVFCKKKKLCGLLVLK